MPYPRPDADELFKSVHQHQSQINQTLPKPIAVQTLRNGSDLDPALYNTYSSYNNLPGEQYNGTYNAHSSYKPAAKTPWYKKLCCCICCEDV